MANGSRMARVVAFTFNPFQENTYLVVADNSSCAIFDPGCSNPTERKQLTDYIEENNLRPEWLINTHCHIDHVYGNAFIAEKYDLRLAIHPDELQVLKAVPVVAQMYGIPFDPSDIGEPSIWLEEGASIKIGETTLNILLTPGHSPASLSFYDEAGGYVIAGDVLFQGSIGRTDLPGGDYDTLIKSIQTQLLTLDDDVVVYPGHGPSTTIGAERQSNPFLQAS